MRDGAESFAHTAFPVSVGPYRGEYFGEAQPEARFLEDLARRLATRGRVLSRGRETVTLHALDEDSRPLVVKSFPRTWWRDGDFARNGSKARRAFAIAARLVQHGVGTPRPIAWLDRWEGRKLLESHYFCAFEEGTNFRQEMKRLFSEDPLCRRVLGLMEVVAQAVARMHGAGVFHRDLGNQNILVERYDADSWGNVRFIDLDRARLHDQLTLRQRARDISRLDIPSALLRVFFCMYFGHQSPPREFVEWEARYRTRFALHTASRRYRHPIRTLRARREREPGAAAIERKHLWLWDDRSEQAIGTRTRRERQADYPWKNGLYVVRGALRGALPVRSRYRELMAGAFGREVPLAGRIGMAVGRSQGHGGQERLLLEGLGAVPVLIRIHRHESDASNAAALAEAERLKALGHAVYLSLVQDGACIRDPALWERFVAQWLPAFAGVAGMVEVGHATNREKFGLHDFAGYARMLEVVTRHANAAGGFTLTGPAAIDFEYQALVALLEVLPDASLDALSHHLYVDRRGAPESRQGPFSALEKFAFARAIAAWSPAVKGERLIVSEVNWPITGTGVHSPVSAPYMLPGAKSPHSAVDEDTYASFMLRYYAIALCSGLVDQVYWWRLVARGFGLVDDSEPTWRPRAAYVALKHFVDLLGAATFVEKLPADAGTWALRFRSPAVGDVVMAWAHPGTARYSPPFACATVLSVDGREQPRAGTVALTGSPLYMVAAR